MISHGWAAPRAEACLSVLPPQVQSVQGGFRPTCKPSPQRSTKRYAARPWPLVANSVYRPVDRQVAQRKDTFHQCCGGRRQLDRLARQYFDYKAELALHQKKAIAYQDHFNDLMEAAHGTQFIRVRPAGAVGDRKCDGYLSRTDSVFQVYAPTTIRISDWIAKIDADFEGAKAQWERMRQWVFVHNQHDGLPPDAAKMILKLKGKNLTLTIDQWPPTHLLDITSHMSEPQLTALFGNPPREEDMRTLDRSDIAIAVSGLTRESAFWQPSGNDLPIVSPRKLDYNQLSEHPRRLITAGIAQTSMVEGFFNHHPDPNLRDRAALRMKESWLRLQSTVSPDAAFNELFDQITAHAQGSRGLTASLALLAYLFEECDIFDNPPPEWFGSP